MNRSDDDILAAELRLLRPTPRPQFTAELDERAAAGFPRGARASAPKVPVARLADWWRATTPSRRLVPVLAVALAALVVATGVVAIANSGGGSGESVAMSGEVEAGLAQPGGAGRLQKQFDRALPAPVSPREVVPQNGAAAGGTAAGGAEAGDAEAESEEAVEEPAEESTRAKGYESSIEATPKLGTLPPQADSLGSALARDIERSAYVVLGTKPGEVSAASARVYEAVHAADGIVLHSSVQSGKAGATGASFDLLIPSRKLDDALAAFSQIAEVRERHDATNDITAPTVGAAEELADSNAAIESLLKELGDAETEEERESVEARLREERGRHASIRSALDQLHERSSMSEVTVRIVTGRGAGIAPAGKDDDWGVGDALGDAGDILTVAAGAALIGLAVLGPIALIAILLWGANRFRIRRLRERTLG